MVKGDFSVKESPAVDYSDPRHEHDEPQEERYADLPFFDQFRIPAGRPDELFSDPPANTHKVAPKEATAIQLVSSYNGFGIHTLLTLVTSFPRMYRNIIFVSVAVIDSGSFKGAQEIDALERSVREGLERYVDLARRLGFAADYRMTVATDVVESAVALCEEIHEEFPRSMVFTGQLTFRLEKFYHRMLHNETSFAIQRRLQWEGITTVILPVRVRV